MLVYFETKIIKFRSNGLIVFMVYLLKQTEIKLTYGTIYSKNNKIL